MRQTNYQLVDFLDISPAFDGKERLWKACRPEMPVQHEGCVYITIPFALQENSNEIKVDASGVRKNRVLRIQAINNAMLRVSMLQNTTEGGLTTPPSSEMLQLDTALDFPALSVVETKDGCEIRDAENRLRASVSFATAPVDWWSDLQPGPDEDRKSVV